MKLASLFSGGKDSTYATYLAKHQGHEIKYLVSFFSENKESFMFHTSLIELTKLQAQLMGVEHIIVHTKGEKEKELKDIEKALSLLDIEGVVCGAIASTYQKDRINKICDSLKLGLDSPLWHKDNAQLLREQLELNFESIISSVSAQGFDESWLGRKIDEECIKDLEKLSKETGINIVGEGGEYCTFVVNCPLFSKPIRNIKFKKVWEKDSGYLLPENL